MFGTSESLGQDVLKNKLFNNNKANVLGGKKTTKKGTHTQKTYKVSSKLVERENKITQKAFKSKK